ncbi:PIN domain-containing protein [Algoriphagus sp.]|uniref:PIN domain-containing protein n=1 Tax=Algoriphagus sp. TaxID=1872435 RepID=UPI003297F5A4
MKVVIDTNIIFSVLLNSESSIGDLIFNSQRKFEFYSCAYMRNEIRTHWDKLKKISNLSEDQLQTSFTLVLSSLKFINEEIIPVETWLASEKTLEKIDPDDIDFVALAEFLEAVLWTGDKVLYKGLKSQGFNKLVNTAELLDLRKA